VIVGFAGKVGLSGGDSVNPGKQTRGKEEDADEGVWAQRKGKK
jgi:hypothetical protein